MSATCVTANKSIHGCLKSINQSLFFIVPGACPLFPPSAQVQVFRDQVMDIKDPP